MKSLVRFFTLTGMLIPVLLFAKHVDLREAENLAKNFYFERINMEKPVAYSSITLEHAYTANKSGATELYIFNVQNHGYIIISADDAVTPVLAYSFQYNYEQDKMPAAFNLWINDYQQQIAEVKRLNLPPTEEISEKWSFYANAANVISNPRNRVRTISPLLGNNTWGQGKYYNDLCPIDANSEPYTGNNRVPVGCVATSATQVMHYWGYPKQGTGSSSYNASGYGTQSANYGNTTYRWYNMPDRVTTPNIDVATISYHVGVSVRMGYGSQGSGSQTYFLPDALKNYFGYNSTVVYRSKSASYPDFTSYTDAQWNSMVTAQLDAKQPMVYAGFESGAAGHAFVCDGYQGTNHFHFNFGWDGYGNGYFYISSISPPGGDFTNGQSAVFNIFPATTQYPYYCNGFGTYVTPEGRFDDGSGPVADYQNNANCSYLIAPTGRNYIILNFNRLDTEAGADIVTIYDGETTSAPVLGTFSGTTTPTGSIESTQGKVLITFSSNGSVTKSGWEISYTSRSCGGTQHLTAPSGTIQDGSGTEEYSNFLTCTWIIEPPGATSITLTFTEFETQPVVDRIRIFDDMTSATPVAQLHGATLPSPVTVNSGVMRIIFSTNSSITASGWKANYTSSTSGIESASESKISVYPNPASKNITVVLNEANSEIEIFDVIGKSVFNASGLSGNVMIQVADWPEGMYFLRVRTPSGKFSSAITTVIH